MENLNSRQPAGSLKISKDVIVTIARTAAKEVDGVVSLTEGESSRLFARGIGKKPVRVVLSDDFAEIDLQLVLKAGAKIPDVCSAVQSVVKDNVQTMTGIAVSKVNIVVAGISFPEEG